MRVGIPKEVKSNENRVSVVPEGVVQLIKDGHEVFVQSSAGNGIGCDDNSYISAGATVLPRLEDIYAQAQFIVKVKEPQEHEVLLLTPDHTIFTYLHLASNKKLTQSLMKSGSSCIAYETVQLSDNSLPLLTPMSEVAGKVAVQAGANHLQFNRGGKGILLGGVPGTRRGKVTVIGCGRAGSSAIQVALGMGAQVTAIDISHQRLSELDLLYGSQITTLYSSPHTIKESLKTADLVIGAVLVPGAKATQLITREMIEAMSPGSVVADIAVDQGGCIETTRPTTHDEPTFTVGGVIHYCVANIPGAVPNTSTYALTNVTFPYIRTIANLGLTKAAEADSALRAGINIYKGDLVYQQIADDLNLAYRSLVLT